MKSITTLFSVLRSILNHPFNREQKFQSVLRFLKWQINSSINTWKVIYPVTEHTVMIAEKGMTGITGSIYSGLLEFEDMMFLLHFLRSNDLFVDIGANVGIYTILASGEIGSDAISVEPIKKTFDTLTMNVKLNNIEQKVTLMNIGIGSRVGELVFTSKEDTVNHVISENESKEEFEIEKVMVNTLDNICFNRKPILIKIDVEGFETNVIEGGYHVLNCHELKGIIIELNGSGSRYGFNEQSIHEKLLSYGFSCFTYEPYKRNLIPLSTYGPHNTLYLRDLDLINERVHNSPKICIKNKQI